MGINMKGLLQFTVGILIGIVIGIAVFPTSTLTPRIDLCPYTLSETVERYISQLPVDFNGDDVAKMLLKAYEETRNPNYVWTVAEKVFRIRGYQIEMFFYYKTMKGHGYGSGSIWNRTLKRDNLVITPPDEPLGILVDHAVINLGTQKVVFAHYLANLTPKELWIYYPIGWNLTNVYPDVVYEDYPFLTSTKGAIKIKLFKRNGAFTLVFNSTKRLNERRANVCARVIGIKPGVIPEEFDAWDYPICSSSST